MSAARNQLAKAKRLLAVIEEQKAGDQAHDTVFSFFENCWHVKDHLKNDSTVPQSVRDSVEDDVKQFDDLMIAADIANRSKHLVLNRPPRRDARISVYHITAYEGSDQEPSASYEISLAGGSTRDALAVARGAVAAWDCLFTRYHL